MNSSKLHTNIILSILLLLLFTCHTISQPDFESYSCDDDAGNYTTTSQYRTNLKTLLSSITSNAQVNYGFYNLSVGQKLDVVHGLALCRPDISTPDCKTCIGYAATKIAIVCPVERTAIGWYPTCMLWYSNQNIFKGEASHPRFNLTSQSVSPSSSKSFNQTMSTLMMSLANKAALGDSRRKYATGEANITSTLRIYALLQCIPDLQEYDCFMCLNFISSYILTDCCYGKQGVRAGGPTCNIRFENYKFYNSVSALPPLPSLPSSPPPGSTIRSRGNRSGKIRVAIITIISTVASLIILVMLVCCYLRKGRKPVENVGNEEGDEIGMDESVQLDFGVVKASTDSFSESNKLGQGGFGIVYKGTLPNSGQLIAVKRLSMVSGQGEQEFKTEALLVAKLQHRNLVRFLGFCLQKEERLLVYEYVPNRSLDYFLFDPIKSTQLDWQKRYRIIGGIARGLLYLHEESRLLVVHRDLKASNVLLDGEMNPKIADFGMARLFGADQSHANTNKIAGTYGYMPPEYVVHGHYSIKSDVFSFGVLVLEIISGQKVCKFSQPEKGESLLSFAWRSWLDGNALELVDSTMSAVHTSEVLRCINIGLLCVQENASQRPIMSSVVQMLNSYTVSLPVPSRPAFLVQNDMDSDPPNLGGIRRPLSVYGSVNEVSLSNLDPR